jgi:anthranilate phosphoribosyltransferase
MSDLTPDTFKHLLKKLIQHPDTFTPANVAHCFAHLCLPSHTGATEAQVGAFLTALTLSGIDGDPEVVAACAGVLRDHAVRVESLEPRASGESGEGKGGWDYERTDGEGDGYRGLVDVVGTGGDGHDAFNVSTTAAVVVAGTGVRVAKVSRALISSFLLILH